MLTITADQVRGARGMLNLTREELARQAMVSKRSLMDFELGERYPREATGTGLKAMLEAMGIVFIDADEHGNGPGIRLRLELPRLFRRDHIFSKGWVAFAFDYKNKRHVGFIHDQELARIALDNLQPRESFDRHQKRILHYAASKADKKDFDPKGNITIATGEMERIPYSLGE